MCHNFAFQTSTVRIVLSHPNLHLRVYLSSLSFKRKFRVSFSAFAKEEKKRMENGIVEFVVCFRLLFRLLLMVLDIFCIFECFYLNDDDNDDDDNDNGNDNDDNDEEHQHSFSLFLQV